MLKGYFSKKKGKNDCNVEQCTEKAAVFNKLVNRSRRCHIYFGAANCLTIQKAIKTEKKKAALKNTSFVENFLLFLILKRHPT